MGFKGKKAGEDQVLIKNQRLEHEKHKTHAI